LCPRAQRCTHERQHFPYQSLAAGAAPFQSRGLHDEAAHQIGMASSEDQRDRPTHRIPHRNHVRDTELAHDRRCVVGDVGQLERLTRPQPSAVAPVIDADERTHLSQSPVGSDELQVGRRRPPV